MELILRRVNIHMETKVNHNPKRIKCLFRIQIQSTFKHKMPFIKTWLETIKIIIMEQQLAKVLYHHQILASFYWKKEAVEQVCITLSNKMNIITKLILTALILITMGKIIKNNLKISKLFTIIPWIKETIRIKSNKIMKCLEEWVQMNKVHS